MVTQNLFNPVLDSPVQRDPVSAKHPDRGDLVRAAESLARLFGSPESLTEYEADEILDALSRIPGTEFAETWSNAKEFTRVWNANRQTLVGSTGALPLEESVYKAWTTDTSHPLSGETGMTWGDPASHMLDVLESFGMITDPEATRAPDNLAVLLEFLGFLIENRLLEEIQSFCRDHLDWLAELRKRAEKIGVHEAIVCVVDATDGLARYIISTSAWEKNRA
jgi:hypothetical protein